VKSFDLYGLAATLLPKAEESKPKATTRNNGATYTGFDARKVADKLQNPKPQTARGFTYYDCPNCGNPGKFWIKDDNGKHGCFEPNSVCDWRKLRDKVRELAGVEEPATSDEPPPIREICLVDVQIREVDWLWDKRIPRGLLTIVEGIEGVGKSTLLGAIAAAVTRGQGLQDMHISEPGNVVWLSAEDDLGMTLKPRLLDAGADIERVFAVGEPFTLDKSGVALVREMVERRRPSLVIIDPIFAYSKGDPSKGADARATTNELKKIAEEFNCAIVLVRHVGKAKGMGDPRAAGLYSIEWRAAARSVLLAGCDPDDPQKRALTQTKSNLGELAESIGYVIERDDSLLSKARFSWKGVSDLTPKRILANQTTEDDEQKNARSDAEEFLREVLSDGPCPVEDVKAEARSAAISDRTLRRAKETLGVVSRSTGYAKSKIWYWCLGGQPVPLGGHTHKSQQFSI
jgi:AAA domain